MRLSPIHCRQSFDTEVDRHDHTYYFAPGQSYLLATLGFATVSYQGIMSLSEALLAKRLLNAPRGLAIGALHRRS
jgi:hypothetical protein